MTPRQLVLLQLLRDPTRGCELDLRDWDLAIRQGRRAGVLARLYAIFQEEKLLDSLPAQPRRHLEWADRYAAHQHLAVNWEIDRILHALAALNVPVMLLKGAAYVFAGLPPARGRLFADVDIMVPRDRLVEVEKALRLHGWESVKLDAYDQRYYRRWMHELPPLRHGRRLSTVDVHHTILPLTARAHPDPDQLWEASIAQSHPRGELRILGPVDMVLHALAHRFFDDGQFDNGLRDLCDIHDLLVLFGQRPGFWEALQARAELFELLVPLHYALYQCRALLGTTVPSWALEAKRCRRDGLVGGIMRTMLARALLPKHTSCNDALSGAARALLYVRSHYLRMPPHLLVPHLVRKSLRSDKAKA